MGVSSWQVLLVTLANRFTPPCPIVEVGYRTRFTGVTPMFLTLGQAAKVCGKSKPTISKAIKSGRISATKDDLGRYQIEQSELERVYPATSKNLHADTPSGNPVNHSENMVLHAELKAAHDAVARLEAENIRAWAQADDWKAQAQRLLPAPFTESSDTAAPKRRSWWPF
jgi:excisionase family DNA binding protein